MSLCAEKLGSLALSFEDHFDCWLLEECSPPAAQALEDYFVQIIVPCTFSDIFEILVLPVPSGCPQLLVQWMSALQSVLTLTDERGRGEGGHPSCTQRLSGVWSCAGSKEEPARRIDPVCEVAVTHHPAFICSLLCLQRGWRSCGWSWELSLQPISAVSEDGVGMQAATPVVFCAAGRSSQGNLNEAEKKG